MWGEFGAALRNPPAGPSATAAAEAARQDERVRLGVRFA
jgi:hypothetical protein